jgi:hypothetical protein
MAHGAMTATYALWRTSASKGCVKERLSDAPKGPVHTGRAALKQVSAPDIDPLVSSMGDSLLVAVYSFGRDQQHSAGEL